MSSVKGKRARHELVQACAGAIIDVLETHAQNGFKCLLHDTKYVTVFMYVLTHAVQLTPPQWHRFGEVVVSRLGPDGIRHERKV